MHLAIRAPIRVPGVDLERSTGRQTAAPDPAPRRTNAAVSPNGTRRRHHTLHSILLFRRDPRAATYSLTLTDRSSATRNPVATTAMMPNMPISPQAH